MELSDKSPKIHFAHLDSIRFIAAMMIVVIHTYEGYQDWFGKIGFLQNEKADGLSRFGSFVNQFVNNFGIGVDVFFLLSGFLITFILLEEKKKTGSINIKFFMIRRSLRIWPLYFLLIGLTPFLVKWLGVPQPEYWSNLLFWNNFRGIQTGLWTYPFSHFWSICIEEHFYLVWPFFIAFTPKKHLLSLFTLLIAFSIGFRLYHSFQSVSVFPWVYLHTFSRMDVLVVGAFAAYFYSEHLFEFKLSKIARLVLYAVLFTSFFIESYSNWETHFMAGFKKYFYILIMGLLMLDYNFNPILRLRLSGSKVINYLGRVSYGIYMYHNILVLIIIKKIMYVVGSNSALLFFSLMIGLSILIPIISYELFEKHFLKMGQRYRIMRIER